MDRNRRDLTSGLSRAVGPNNNSAAAPKAGSKRQKQKNNNNKERPPKRDTNCRFWLKGTCRNGASCDFKHPDGKKGTKASAAAPGDASESESGYSSRSSAAAPKKPGGRFPSWANGNAPCFYFSLGKCQHNEKDCRFKHRTLEDWEVKFRDEEFFNKDKKGADYIFSNFIRRFYYSFVINCI